MGKIRVLDDLVANQIAAGEVVERPASVVKELLENAIDAGAKRITIHIEEGGLKRIEVLDDGSGMMKEDVAIAFVRHATSKLSVIDDLRKLHTLGFRGEALPSIAAVSRLTLTTRTAEQDEGVHFVIEGGTVQQEEPIGCPVGTKIVVADLFYNTPARLKFIRSLQTETAHVYEVVGRAAAARPDIAFTLLADGKTQVKTVGDGAMPTLFSALYNVTIAKSAVAIVLLDEQYQLRGMMALPEYAKTTRKAMWFSINGRPVRSYLIADAVLDGCATMIMKGRFPLICLDLTLDPSLVDVNVHPSKLEVRFSEEQDVRQLIKQAIQDALKAGIMPPEINVSSPLAPSFVKEASQQEQVVLRPRLSNAYSATTTLPNSRSNAPRYGKETAAQVAFAIQEPIFEESKPQDVVRQKVNQTLRERRLRAVGQVLTMYIVAQDGESIYLIDQHAAHERVMYERFKQQFQERDHFALPLLVPITQDLPPSSINLLMQKADLATSYGFTFEPFGEQSIVIRTIPSIWEGLDTHQLIDDFITDLLEEKAISDRLLLEDRIIMRSCKAAIKANQTLSLLEMNALLDALAPLNNPFTCPHGRPTAMIITKQQLEREFKRT